MIVYAQVACPSSTEVSDTFMICGKCSEPVGLFALSVNFSSG
jgi:hypothetical protein